MTSFRPHPVQLQLEAMERRGNEMAIIAQAASPEEAKLCLEDLRQHGIAIQSSDGKRVEPRTGQGRFQYVRFDEERR